MPRPDPLPAAATPPVDPRVRRRLRWLAAFSAAIGALAVALVHNGDREVHIHMLIATFLGVSLTMLLGMGLMSLVFLSNRSGHDARAADHQDIE